VSTGYPITKVDLDNRMGAMIVDLRDALEACVLFNSLLNDATILGGTALTDAPLSYTAAENTLIRAAFTDLQKLRDISRNSATQATSSDFWFSAKHLAGLNFH
jgi:hypothetical protein